MFLQTKNQEQYATKETEANLQAQQQFVEATKKKFFCAQKPKPKPKPKPKITKKTKNTKPRRK